VCQDVLSTETGNATASMAKICGAATLKPRRGNHRGSGENRANGKVTEPIQE